jgi:branched-chain amino acid transport system permease protein
VTDYLLFALLGLGTGAVYASLGLGIVLAYKGSGIINFAQGAMAMYIAYAFNELRTSGDLVLPVLGLPARVDLGEALGFWAAFIIALELAVILGLFSYFFVFRPLRYSPTLTKVVAAIGLMIVLQAMVVLRFGTANRSFAPVLPASPIELAGMRIPQDRLTLGLLTIVMAALLYAFYQYTRFGNATRAAAESEKGAILLGYSPEVLAAVNWVLATVVAGLTGMLLGGITALDPVTYTLAVVPALGAALVGRFSSFGATAAAGLMIGMAQSMITKLQADFAWLPRSGLKEGIPFLVIILALVIAGRMLPTRGELSRERLPIANLPKDVPLYAIAALGVGVVAMYVTQGGLRVALIVSVVGAILCLSLVVLTGFVGQISLAQMTFAGAAGFALSALSTRADIPLVIGTPIALIVATVLGVVIGLPALRVRGVNLAVVTLGAAVAIEAFIFRNPIYTGGFAGSRIPSPVFFGVNLGIGGEGRGDYPRPIFGIFALVVLALMALAVVNLRKSATGRRMLAVRANERAAAAAGINVTSIKLLAFALSSFIAGVGGILLAFRQGQISFESFGVFVSLALLAAVVLGGISSVSGAIVGGGIVASGLTFIALDRWLGLGQYTLFISGLALIFTAILNPKGVAGAVRDALDPAAENPNPRERLAGLGSNESMLG